MNFEKEFNKLIDLEKDLELAQMLERKGQLDGANVIIAYHKYRKQYRKVEKMQNEGQGVEGLRVESSN